MHWTPLLAAVAVVSAIVAAGRWGGWFRDARNFEGRSVLVAGVALVLGVLAGLASLFALGYDGRAAQATLVATVGFGFFGAVDDRWGDRSATGFRGHLRALAGGRVTTGFWKIVGGGVTALAAAWLLFPPSGALGWTHFLGRAAVIALAANALNLLDTRPVRAVAVFLFLSALTALATGVGPATGVVAASAVAFLPWDRRRTAMLGDAGSNVLGAAWGVALCSRAGGAALAGALIALIALHVYTERHSLNATIAARPWLRRLDAWLRGGATKAV